MTNDITDYTPNSARARAETKVCLILFLTVEQILENRLQVKEELQLLLLFFVTVIGINDTFVL